MNNFVTVFHGSIKGGDAKDRLWSILWSEVKLQKFDHLLYLEASEPK